MTKPIVLIFNVLLQGKTVMVRRVELRVGWFGRVNVSTNLTNHNVIGGDTVTIDLPTFVTGELDK